MIAQVVGERLATPFLKRGWYYDNIWGNVSYDCICNTCCLHRKTEI